MVTIKKKTKQNKKREKITEASSSVSLFLASYSLLDFREFKAPSTLIRFQTKTELFCSGYGYRPHYNAENDPRKRSHSKTLSRVERFGNDAFWKRCFLVWTVKTMLSENGDVIKTTGEYPKWRTGATM